MTSSEDSGEVLPLTESAKCNLSAAEAYEYLTKAGNVYKKLTCLSPYPPVQPRGGSIFLYDLGPEKSKWEANKKKIRYFVCVLCFLFKLCYNDTTGVCLDHYNNALL